MADTCILCGNIDCLNTSITISLEDNTKVSVVICDTCADDATPKRVRAAFIDKQRQIDEVMAQARALGLDLSVQPSKQKIMVVQQTTPSVVQQAIPKPAQPELESMVSPLIDDEDGPVIATSNLMKPMRSVGGNAELSGIRTNVPTHQSHNLDEPGAGVLHGKAKVTMVEGRAGMPLQLPSLIQDGTGTTRLRVAQQMDDAILQRKFKSLGSESRWDRGPDFRSGYDAGTERKCPICDGTGRARNFGKTVACPKCQGIGIIIV